MNAPRKKQVVAPPDTHEFGGWAGTIQKHLNTALTVLLLIAAVFLFVRWRMRSAEMAKESITTELNNARYLVGRLSPAEMQPLYPEPLIKTIQSTQNGANSAISNVLNSSDTDARMRADALTLRGNMYWYLANLPPLPGAATRPSLQLSESSDALLQKASDSYQEVLKNSTYIDQHEQLDSAHLGLAAIAENRSDWSTAKSELEAVVNDSAGLTVLAHSAQIQLNLLPKVQKKLYVAPPTGMAPIAVPTLAVPTPAMPKTQVSIPDVTRSVLPTTLPTHP